VTQNGLLKPESRQGNHGNFHSSGGPVMTLSVLIAAPLLIAAVAGAVRFVGCTEDFDQFEPHGGDGENGNGGDAYKTGAKFSGSGQLTATATLAHPPKTDEFSVPGTYNYDIEPWCTEIYVFVLGAGGGGSPGVPAGRGGQGGLWGTVKLWRGAGDDPDGNATPLPPSTTSITITVGSGGPGGANPNAGGDTTATADGMDPLTGAGGSAAFSNDATGLGAGSATIDAITETGGGDQTVPNGDGIGPGGGGAGGLIGGGNGADGAAWVIAFQN
jgi:hypothetical protein